MLVNVFLTHREISTDEAVYRLLSMPLRESNRKVIFIPTDEPHKRTCILKPQKELEGLPEDSLDIFQTNILDKYAARPDNSRICVMPTLQHATPLLQRMKMLLK